jgi:hypothetical protein
MIADDTTEYSFARQHFRFSGHLCETRYLFVPLRALCVLEMGQANLAKFSEGVHGILTIGRILFRLIQSSSCTTGRIDLSLPSFSTSTLAVAILPFITLRLRVIAPTILSPCLNFTPPNDRVRVSLVFVLGTA